LFSVGRVILLDGVQEEVVVAVVDDSQGEVEKEATSTEVVEYMLGRSNRPKLLSFKKAAAQGEPKVNMACYCCLKLKTIRHKNC